jgi:hypothetical protein
MNRLMWRVMQKHGTREGQPLVCCARHCSELLRALRRVLLPPSPGAPAAPGQLFLGASTVEQLSFRIAGLMLLLLATAHAA